MHLLYMLNHDLENSNFLGGELQIDTGNTQYL